MRSKKDTIIKGSIIITLVASVVSNIAIWFKLYRHDKYLGTLTRLYTELVDSIFGDDEEDDEDE